MDSIWWDYWTGKPTNVQSHFILMPSLSTNDALNEEISVLRSIYDLPILEITSNPTDSGSIQATLALPTTSITFNVSFPPSYPDAPPSITGTHHVSASTRPGEGEAAAETLRNVLAQVYIPGQVCLFDLVEEAGPLLAYTDDSGHAQDNGTAPGQAEDLQTRSVPTQHDSYESAYLTDVSNKGVAARLPEPQWVLSDPVTFNKSTFVARCLPVSELSQATDAMSHLLATNKKVAGATHNISAWRLKQAQTARDGGGNAADVIVQDCDDDGETAAGGRLLHLMHSMDVWNCVVVVTRWYGGVKLGPDRFRLINAVAREAIVRSGLGKEEGKKGKDGGKAKKK